PDEDLAILIHSQSLSLDEFGCQIFQIRLIEIELPLEGAIGQAPPALEHGQRFVENLFKGHRHPPLPLRRAEDGVGMQRLSGQMCTANDRQRKAGSTSARYA